MAEPVDVALAGEHLSNSLSLLFVFSPNAREWHYGKPAGDTNCLEILLEEEKTLLDHFHEQFTGEKLGIIKLASLLRVKSVSSAAPSRSGAGA